MGEAPLQTRIKTIKYKDPLWRNVFAEFVGTFLLVFVGLCIVGQFHLGRGQTTDWITLLFGWGFAIMLAVLATSKTSGGHLNPAMSLLFYTFGHIDLKSFLLYCVAQTAGAFLGAMCMYGYYIDAFNAYDKGVRSVLGATGTGVCFCSYPAPYLSFMGPWIDQVVGTACLAYFASIIIDKRNGIPPFWHPFFIGFMLLMIGTGFGMNLGFPINPARDFGPRLFSFFTHGADVFLKPYPSFFLAPLLAPFPGALLGGWLYQVTVGIHIPVADEEITENGKHEQETKLLA